MDYINCPHCGEKISKESKECPYCFKPLKQADLPITNHNDSLSNNNYWQTSIYKSSGIQLKRGWCYFSIVVSVIVFLVLIIYGIYHMIHLPADFKWISIAILLISFTTLIPIFPAIYLLEDASCIEDLYRRESILQNELNKLKSMNKIK